MALDPRKRQKKLERRQAKQRVKKRLQKQQGSPDLVHRMQRASASPILHCCTTADLWDQGIGQVLISRELPGGRVAFASFLLDRYCLGVKDVMFDIAPRERYEWQLYTKLRDRYHLTKLKSPCARKLVEGGVQYARDLGIAPHPDYPKARWIFGDIDPGECHEAFEYGKDGKPLFVAGPYDRPERCRQIVNTLSQRCGSDGFHYLIPIEASGARVDMPGDEYDF